MSISNQDISDIENTIEKVKSTSIRSLKDHHESLVLFLFALFFTLTSCIYYLTTMLTISNPGLTLDDSWIHIQFSYVLFKGTPWEYSPGYPSTGSTSPLWSVLLSPIFFFTSTQYGIVWATYLISTTLFIGSTYLVGRLVTNYVKGVTIGVVAMLSFVMIPRNTWLMLSGMETPLFVFILLLSILFLDHEDEKYDLLLGALAGLAFLSRPEGIIIALCIPVRFAILGYRRKIDRTRVGLFMLSGVFAFLVVSPWILHCLMTTGYPLPDTFYAKVHPPLPYEIAAWDSWWTQFTHEMPYLIIGIFMGVILVAKGKPFPWIIPLALTILYRVTTPYAALINNARYLVPVFDLFLIAAITVGALIIKSIISKVIRFLDDVTANAICALLLVIIFIIPMTPHYIWQATHYGKAAGNINDMQVHLGHWLNENTPPDAVFATHDAGALRFFSNRTMIDLAGLVSPDILHGNMTNTEKIQYLHDHGCNYFVFFDVLFRFWSIYLPYNSYQKIYTVHLEDNVICGRDTMSVFRIYWELTPYSQVTNP